MKQILTILVPERTCPARLEANLSRSGLSRERYNVLPIAGYERVDVKTPFVCVLDNSSQMANAWAAMAIHLIENYEGRKEPGIVAFPNGSARFPVNGELPSGIKYRALKSDVTELAIGTWVFRSDFMKNTLYAGLDANFFIKVGKEKTNLVLSTFRSEKFPEEEEE